MSVFEPQAVLANLKMLQPRKEQAQFAIGWKSRVEKRWKSWKGNRETQSQVADQLEWAANVVEYVNHIWKLAMSHAKKGSPAVPKDVPIYGPRFVPPSYLHAEKRSTTPSIHVKTTYLKPLNIIHPFYHPELRCCPRCGCTDERVSWNGWTGTGHREVHGIRVEETALGYQLKCDACREAHEAESEKKESDLPQGSDSEKFHYHFATTNCEFWERRHHWDVPLGIPYFFKRCAVTRELFDLIVEMRPSGTSGGLAHHIKQLHLFEYHQQRYTYLKHYEAQLARPNSLVNPPPLEQFSKPGDNTAGYDPTSITDDLVTDVYLEFSQNTRRAESEAYMRTLTGICLSLDNTFRLSGKATVIYEKTTRLKLMKGGILSVINELNEIISWRFCQSEATTEIREQLLGLRKRFEALNVAFPEMAVADNCCHVRSAIKGAFPEIVVLLDVWHFMMRYMLCIVGGTENPLRSAVARDITDAILKTPADKYNKSEYWDQHEQERRLQAAYDKYVEKGGVWNVAAAKTHQNQLNHVRKGCLARPREDVSSDGSRIEGTHKGWNGLQRAHSSGIEVMLALSSDFVLRRNIRTGFTRDDPTPFLRSTHGSHHIGLVNAIAGLWNKLLARTMKTPPAGFSTLPVLPIVESGESFGLVTSETAEAYYQLTEVKDEDEKELVDISQLSEEARKRMIEGMGMDPATFPSDGQVSREVAIIGQRTQGPTSSEATSSRLRIAGPAVPAAAASRCPPATHDHDRAEIIDVDASDEIIDVDAGSETIDADASNEIIDVDTSGASEPEVLAPSTPSQNPSPISVQHAIAIFQAAAGLQQRFTASASAILPTNGSTLPETGVPDAGHGDGALAQQGSMPSVSSQGTAFGKQVGSAGPTKRKAVAQEDGLASNEASRPLENGAAKRARVGDPTTVALSIPAASKPRRKPRGTAVSEQRRKDVQAGSRSSLLSFFPVLPSQRADEGSERITMATVALPSRPAVSVPMPAMPQETVARAASTHSPSARIFTLATRTDPRSLVISTRDEWFTFMDLRKEKQWVSHAMTPARWVIATQEYNEQLRTKLGSSTVDKVPRALMNKLFKVEGDVLRRTARNDYASRSGKTEFWTKHCEAVMLLFNNEGKKKHISHMCGRCKSIMWPYPSGCDGNHARSYCSDGVARSGRDGDTFPQWPQPAGVFSGGDKFHAATFLRVVMELYERFVVEEGSNTSERMMEYTVFSEMLQARSSQQPDGTFLFKLFKTLAVADAGTSTVSKLIVRLDDGCDYLRIDTLAEPALNESEGEGDDR
ncbi:hypothetical protein DENSPDRAFT_852057 [Dentipellis sp. KUC8613]|nr:hypothetical protein DENSPDRAFT_852057 [Dentipellis sp. KUC8613]